MIGMRLAVLWACYSLTVGCAASSARSPDSQPAQSCEPRTAQDSSITLLQVAPADSVWLKRNGITIILSMQDAEAYFTIGRLSDDTRALRDEIREAFRRDGTAQLSGSGLSDLLAAYLLFKGKAIVRGPHGEPFRCVWTRLETVEVDGRVIAHRVFDGPSSPRFLRVLESVTVS